MNTINMLSFIHNFFFTWLGIVGKMVTRRAWIGGAERQRLKKRPSEE